MQITGQQVQIQIQNLTVCGGCGVHAVGLPCMWLLWRWLGWPSARTSRLGVDGGCKVKPRLIDRVCLSTAGSCRQEKWGEWGRVE